METKKFKREYEIKYETWIWNEEEELYCDGPFNEKEFSVETLSEAKAYIKEFTENYPKNRNENIGYDRQDLDVGIYNQKLLCAKVADYVDEKTNEKMQLEFTVFRVDYLKT